MTSALLLVDLQEDYLATSGLVPSRGELVEQAARLLERCRAARVPVFHVWTTVRRDDDRRMPHWRASGRWVCVAGTPGHAPPPELVPRDGEEVAHKTHFSAFDDGTLAPRLRARGVAELWLAGVHAHACVRATALDAYRLGFSVVLASGAVGSAEPLHADVTRRWLAARGVRSVPAASLPRRAPATRDVPHEADAACGAAAAPLLPLLVLGGSDVRRATDGAPAIEHRAPGERDRVLWRVPLADANDVAAAAGRARDARAAWRSVGATERLSIAARIASVLESASAPLARRMAVEIGKPLADARLEVEFARALVEAAARRAREVLARPDAPPGPLGRERRRPLGTVALVTPWNVPLAIPLGKIVPALLYGNTVVWKPAPAGSGIAFDVLRLVSDAGVPAGAVTLVLGDHATAEHLLAEPLVDAVSLTGSSAVGTCAQAICAARRIPLQAELGGNNAAIVWSDCDLDDAAAKIAAGAFGSAGQRCTANRRAIVDARVADAFVARLVAASGALRFGDPLDPGTRVGPLVSDEARARVAGVVSRAAASGHAVTTAAAHAALEPALAERGAYLAPRIVRCEEPAAEVVQEETFGPVLVVQSARGWDEALARLNGVAQGLVAALFSASPERRASFLDEAQAGILKVGSATAGVGAETPFGGWKASGVGPAEHGSGDAEFYTRAQAVYVEDAAPRGAGPR